MEKLKYWSLFQSTRKTEGSSPDNRKKKIKHPTGILNSPLSLNNLQDDNWLSDINKKFCDKHNL